MAAVPARLAAKPLMACWLECAASAVLGLSPSPERRIWFVLDELADLPRVENLARLLPEGRKFGAAIVLTFQALGQMRNRYGANIAEAAQKLGLNATTIEAVDRSGRGLDGKPVTGLPQGIDVVSPAFASNIGVENEPIQYNGGELWFDVLGVTPSRDRALDEVKDQVETRWKDEQISTRLRAKAAEMVGKIEKGATLETEAVAAGVKVETAKLFKRDGEAKDVPERLVAAAFRTPKDGVGQTEGNGASEWVVFKVTDIVVPPVDLASEDVKKLTENLRRAEMEEQLGAYIAKLETDIGVTINQNAFAVATGAASAQ